MPIHLALEGEHLAAFTYAICNQLADDHVQITDHLKAHSRLMSEVLDEPAGTALDAGRIISAIKTARDLNDELRKSLKHQQAEIERIQGLYTTEFNKADRYRNVICFAVDKLGKRKVNLAAVADFLMDAIKTEE